MEQIDNIKSVIKNSCIMYENHIDCELLKMESNELAIKCQELLPFIDDRKKCILFNKYYSALFLQGIAYNYNTFFRYSDILAEDLISVFSYSMLNGLNNWDTTKSKFLTFLYSSFIRALNVKRNENNYHCRKANYNCSTLSSFYDGEEYEEELFAKDDTFSKLILNINSSNTLSNKEKNILIHIAEGYTKKEIMKILNLSYYDYIKITQNIRKEKLYDFL